MTTNLLEIFSDVNVRYIIRENAANSMLMLLQRVLLSPRNKHCSFYPKVGSYLENLWCHVPWKEACALWRTQTSSVKRGKNKSDATHLVTESHYTNLSILNSMKLWHNKERKESRKGCKSTFFKSSGESRKSVKRDIGTKKTRAGG